MIKQDPDQTEAVEKIVSHGVTVMSGKGGCGKTEVVATIFMDAGYSTHEDESLIDLDGNIQPPTPRELQNGIAGLAKIPNTPQFWTSPIKSKSIFIPQAKNGSTLSTFASPVKHGCGFVTPPNSPTRALPGYLTPKRPCTPGKLDLSGFNSPGKVTKDEPPPTVLLTAPTGKAANLLGKRTRVKAYTMHQVIYSFLSWKKVLKEMKEAGVTAADIAKKQWHFHEVNVWVVDECSLVSVKPFCTLMGMLKWNASIKKLVLLGDIHQLPSVEPGNFLEDIYKALERYGFAVKLTKNYRYGTVSIVG